MARPDRLRGPDAPEHPFPLKLRGPVIQGFGRGSKDLGIPTANIPLSGLSIDGNQDLDSGIYYGFCTLDYSTIGTTPTNTTTTTTTNLPPSSSSSSASETSPQPTSTTNQPQPQPTQPPAPSQSFSVAPLAYPSHTLAPSTVLPCVLSIGYNPYYGNTTRSIEIHIMHAFSRDFYGATLSLMILGFIRPEYDYVSRDALVQDILTDIAVAGRSLEREGYARYREDGWLVGGG